MKVIIFTRFSEIRKGTAAYNAASSTTEAYIAKILNPNRLRLRLRLLQDILLPSIASQSTRLDRSWFRFVLTITPELPSDVVQKLKEITTQHPWASVIVDANTISIMKEFLSEGDKEASHNFASIRIDDDDAVGRGFLQSILRYQDEAFADHVVSFPSGYAGWYDTAKSKIGGVVKAYHQLNSIGLCYIGRYDPAAGKVTSTKTSVWECGTHNRVDRIHPVIIDARQNMFFRTVHPEQDTSDVSMQEIVGRPWVDRAEVLADIALPENALATAFYEPAARVNDQNAAGWTAAINSTIEDNDPRKAEHLQRAGLAELAKEGVRIGALDNGEACLSGLLVHSEQDAARVLVAVKGPPQATGVRGFKWSEGGGFWYKYINSNKADPSIKVVIPGGNSGSELWVMPWYARDRVYVGRLKLTHSPA